MQPLVSILIPVYNGENTIAAALESCLEQTYANIEIIVCNDGSTDNTLHEINIENSDRISIINHSTNRGIAHTRNTLLKAAKGEYIAWLDADDMMDEERIELQLNYMLANVTIDICGTWAMVVGNYNYTDLKKLPTNAELVKAQLWFKNCLLQPSVMSKNFYVKENIFYNAEFDYMEDYELWYRLSGSKTIANFEEYLTFYQAPDEKTLAQKHLKYRFDEKQAKLWDIKWQKIPQTLGKDSKKIFQQFIKSNKKLRAYEVKIILKCLSIIQTYFNQPIVNKLTEYQRFRVFKNASFLQKLKHLNLGLKVFKAIKIKTEYHL